jgi:DNA replicative helicase MCM subunit Mcm2 (Cdc46/Mcm family)
MKKKIKNVTKEELLEKLERCYTALVKDGRIVWAGETIDNDDDFKQVVEDAIKEVAKAKVTMKDVETVMRKVRTELKTTALKPEALPKNNICEITQEDKDLLVEIENVLCMRSRQIWGLTHTKKIKGGGDITPYETGYDKLFEFMDLVARIIG